MYLIFGKDSSFIREKNQEFFWEIWHGSGNVRLIHFEREEVQQREADLKKPREE